jgi:hypothetical protein
MNQRAMVRDEWLSYRLQVIPSDAPSRQIAECRRAFYAGAEMLLTAIMSGLDPDKEPTQADQDYLAALHTELLTFARDVKEGKA